jgi:uncharacterized protein (TIGR02246 family)
MELWELSAREQVRDLVARYNAAGDAGRTAEVLALFAPDAVMELPDGSLHEGLEAIERVFTTAKADVGATTPAGVRPHLRHHTSTLVIDMVSPAEATSRCYYQVLMPHGLDHWGRYVDRFEQRSGRWRFVRRKVTLDGWHPGGIGEAFARGDAGPGR